MYVALLALLARVLRGLQSRLHVRRMSSLRAHILPWPALPPVSLPAMPDPPGVCCAGRGVLGSRPCRTANVH